MFIRIAIATAALLIGGFGAGTASASDVPPQTGLRIVDLHYLESTNSSRLVIRANLPFSYKAYSEGDSTLVIETDKADTSGIAPGIAIGSRTIDSIKVADRLTGSAKEVTAIMIRHAPGQRYEIIPKGRRLFIDFSEAGTQASAKDDASVVDMEESEEEYALEIAEEDQEEEAPATGNRVGNMNVVSKPDASVEKPAGKSVGAQKESAASETDAALNYRLDPVVKYGLNNIEFRSNGDSATVILSLDRPLERRLYRIVPVGGAPRYVVDFHGATNRLPFKKEAEGNAFFERVRTAQFAVDPYPISRVVFDLVGKQSPRVDVRGNDLVIQFGAAEAVEAIEEPEIRTDVVAANGEIAPAEVVESEEAEVEAIEPVEIVTPDAVEKEPEVAEETSEVPEEAAEPEPEVAEQTKELENETAELEPVESEETVESAETPEEQTEPEEVEIKAEPIEETPVEVEVIESTTTIIEPEPTEVTPDPEPAETQEPAVDTFVSTGVNKPAEEPEPAVAEEPIEENVNLFESEYPDGMKPSAETAKSEPSKPFVPNTSPFQEEMQQDKPLTAPRTQDVQDLYRTREITSGETHYRGKKVSLEFENINLRALILLLGQMTDKNFVVDPSVAPTAVTISLRDLPWDQALDIILDYYGLGKIEENNVIRIASRARLGQEAEERRRLATQRALAVPLRQITKPVNYAQANSLATLIRRNLSQKGEVVVDQRTNTLVISDIPSKVEEHLKLIEALDIPTRQVIVEARIVETTRDYINEFGLQYGFQGSATAEYGSSTGLVYPNNISLSGGQLVETAAGTLPMAVNLPASTINSSILGSFSNINGSFVLDVILTAAESEKKVRVLSRPRISAQNNSRAEIKSGVEVPFQVVQNNTVGIRWREATLKLEVTPHITSDNTIILDLVVDKSSLGVATAVGYTIQKRRATSTVLVKDGGVAVIGGVLEISNNLTVEKVPLLSKIPLIGNLFRNRLERVQNTELLIFISPKIIN